MSKPSAESAAILSALCATEGVSRVQIRKGWVVASVASPSRAAGLAETIREAGFEVRTRDALIAFR